ncbi:MAG: DUF2007 domain-containing protein [Tissierellia bacterium]|mgnify:CR=1 FL=1|nr:DUF2007 domain-containing protein [Tissierellia bacterium]
MFDKNKGNQENKDIQLVLLKTVNNNIELGLITNLLEENNIPYLLRDPGTGGYMRIIGGGSIYGTDILVEESFFERASEIIGSITLTE